MMAFNKQRKSLVYKAVLVTVLFIPMRLLFFTLSDKPLDISNIPADVNMVPASVSTTVSTVTLPKEIVKNQLACHNVLKPNITHYSNTGPYWHEHRDGKDEVFIVSAFYDDRIAGGTAPFVRLLVVATKPVGQHFCYLWFDKLHVPYITKATIQSSGRGERIYSIMYGQYLYSCPLPSSLPVPVNVSIATKQCATSEVLVPITFPKKSNFEHKFGICVAIAFGEVDFPTIVEWIELHKTFGVTEFNIYNASLPTAAKTLFDHYQDEGILNLYQMPPPKPVYNKKGSKLSSPASLNDCVLRNMYRYQYAIVIDFDEFIIPEKHSNYSSMLQSIDKLNNLKEPYQSYTFRTAYHLEESKIDESQPEYLKTLRYRSRAPPCPYLFASKSFIDPRRCLSVFNHYCYIKFPSVRGRLTVDVPTDIAISHHYRNCNFGKEKCKEYLSKHTTDDVILKYKDYLSQRVKSVLEDLHYFDKP